MMLTKEECEKALEHFEKCYWDQDNSYGAMNGVRKDLDILNKLINEHFLNPPLEWEEIKKGDWVWVEPIKEWCKVIKTGYLPYENNQSITKEILVGLNFKSSKFISFRFNRFYKKQVKE